MRFTDIRSIFSFSLLYSYYILVWIFLHEKMFVGVTLGHTVLHPCSTRSVKMVRYWMSAHTRLYLTADSHVRIIYWWPRISPIIWSPICNQLPIDLNMSNSKSNHFDWSRGTWMQNCVTKCDPHQHFFMQKDSNWNIVWIE